MYIVYIVGALIIVSTGIAIFAFFHPFQIRADESNKFPLDFNYSAYSNSSSSSIDPSFTLLSTIGDQISLSDYAGKKNVLSYFQDGIMCTPCWIQLEDIQKEYDKFNLFFIIIK